MNSEIVLTKEQRELIARFLYLIKPVNEVEIKKALRDDKHNLTLVISDHDHSMFQISETDKDARCFVKAKQNNEPTFTLRARDLCAIETITFWQKLVAESNPEKAKATDDIVSIFTEWQDTHQDQCKIPD